MGTLVIQGNACPTAGYRKEEAEHEGAGASALVKIKQALELCALHFSCSVSPGCAGAWRNTYEGEQNM